MLAYSGLRAKHSAVNVAFATLVFGLLATGVLALLNSYSAFLAAPVAFAAALFSGFVWRKWGLALCYRFIRRSNLSWSNDDQSALETLSANSKFRLSQIAVLLDDGTWLECRDTTRFSNAPFGPCLIGPNGDVALYLTHEGTPNGKDREVKSVFDDHYGARITYVPASQIKRLTLRYLHPQDH